MGSKIKHWLKAARLRTLPLALSSILLGSFLAFTSGKHNAVVTLLAVLTTIFLQILSNLANDYGDAVNGVDNEDRIGPQRAVQSGAISLQSMRNAIVVMVMLSLAAGITLVYYGTIGLELKFTTFFIALGILAIAAAIKYTVGKNPYGYQGLGDLFVFAFFGITGVMGTFFLHTHTLDSNVLLPACAVGFLSTGVLNLNNMRDLNEDKKVGKMTLAVKMGIKMAKTYHVTLIVLSVLASVIYTLNNFISPLQFLFLTTSPLFLLNVKAVVSNQNPALLDVQLKKLALSTFLFVLTFGLGLILS